LLKFGHYYQENLGPQPKKSGNNQTDRQTDRHAYKEEKEVL